jgi:inner membrane protein
METNTISHLFERFNQWIAESVMIKLFSIGFLVLILLIPASWIEDLINERQSRADTVMKEVASKWSGAQTFTGPVLVIPFTRQEIIQRWQDGKQVDEIKESLHKAFFLPEVLQLSVEVKPEVLHRGIFDVAVYQSNVQVEARFMKPDFSNWAVPADRVHWKDAALVYALSDLRGISENPRFMMGDKNVAAEPSSDIGINAGEPRTGLRIPLPWNSADDFNGNFTGMLAIRGSEGLYFVPVGKTTLVKAMGEWNAPSFEGQMLPTERTVSSTGFSANWKVLSFNRPFAQKWMDAEQSLSGNAFGVRLLIPADQYQKSTRTAKYDELIILLAFTVLFLVEITTKIKIHPFQYILIGVALIVYYTLLLSLSEQWGYNTAYAISSVATLGLLTFYSSTFLKRKITGLFAALMGSFYVFIFVIIQAEDFSLLIGSIGLFVMVGLLMYFSRNIQWYKTVGERK